MYSSCAHSATATTCPAVRTSIRRAACWCGWSAPSCAAGARRLRVLPAPAPGSSVPASMVCLIRYHASRQQIRLRRGVKASLLLQTVQSRLRIKFCSYVRHAANGTEQKCGCGGAEVWSCFADAQPAATGAVKPTQCYATHPHATCTPSCTQEKHAAADVQHGPSSPATQMRQT